jgi:cytochrome c-type biogenesis protein CcmH
MASGVLPWAPNPQQRELADFDNLLQRLESKVQSEPNRVEGWVLLGRMYDAARRFGDAGQAFDRAAALRPDSPDIAVAAAESRILAANGTVTPDAATRIDQALALDPHHPGARYFKALAQWQAGQRKAAYAAWNDLLRDSPADAPWLPQLRARLTDAAKALGVPPPKQEAAPAARPGPSAEDMARAAQMTPAQRQAMIRSMVASLAARLKAEPNDLDGWMRLGRAYGVLDQHAEAVDAFERARKLAPQDPDVLVGLGQARAEAGDRAGALVALRAARAQLAPDDPRRDQVEQTIRAFQPAAPKPR